LFTAQGAEVNPNDGGYSYFLKDGETLYMRCGGLSFLYPNIVHIVNDNEIFYKNTQNMVNQLTVSARAYYELIEHTMLAKRALMGRLLPELLEHIFGVFSEMSGDLIFRNSLAMVGMFYSRYHIIGLSFIECFVPELGMGDWSFDKTVCGVLKRLKVKELKAWYQRHVTSNPKRMLKKELIGAVYDDVAKFSRIMYTGVTYGIMCQLSENFSRWQQ